MLQRRPGHAVMTHWLKLVRDHRAAGFTGFPQDGKSWQDGAWGELWVGHELSLLPPGWQVLHAVPAGRSGADIDHLVIGPGGVFVLNTKRHPNATIRVGTHVVWVKGFQQNHYQSELRKRCRQVEQVFLRTTGERLAVHPVLVFVQSRSLARSGEQLVFSTTTDCLVGLLQSMPVKLDADQVLALVTAAGRPSTWGASATVLSESDPTSEFLALSGTLPAARTGSRARVPGAAVHRSTTAAPGARLLRALVGLAALAVGLPMAAQILSAVIHAWTQSLIAP